MAPEWESGGGIVPLALGKEQGMKVVELYGRVRYAVRIEGLSRREAARRFGIDTGRSPR